jgi:hypothetical protein
MTNFELLNSNGKCTFGNKTNMGTFEFANPKPQVET